jgi:hypothetical protein
MVKTTNTVKTTMVRVWALLTSTMMTVALLVTQLPIVGNLMATFGLTYSTASYIANLVCTGAITLLVAQFPWLSPFVGLLEQLCSTYGLPYLISW